MTPKPKRVALYLRVSTRDQSFESQEAQLRHYCERRGWKDLTNYREKKSGRDAARTELERLMQDMRAGKIDVVCVYKIDRLGRSIQHTLQCLQEFKTRGVAFVSATEQFDTSEENPLGKMQVALLASMAEIEGDRIRERVIDGLTAARAKGIQFGRPRESDATIKQAIALKTTLVTAADVARAVELTRGEVTRLWAGKTIPVTGANRDARAKRERAIATALRRKGTTLTLSEICRRTGLSKGYLSRVLRGERPAAMAS